MRIRPGALVAGLLAGAAIAATLSACGTSAQPSTPTAASTSASPSAPSKVYTAVVDFTALPCSEPCVLTVFDNPNPGPFDTSIAVSGWPSRDDKVDVACTAKGDRPINGNLNRTQLRIPLDKLTSPMRQTLKDLGIEYGTGYVQSTGLRPLNSPAPSC
jgi:hypothetical protein